MIICITGFGWSGSGAVCDLIREYDDVKFIQFNDGQDFEFRMLFEPDGIKTLDLLLNEGFSRFFSYKPIQRFEKMMKANIERNGYSEIFGRNIEVLTNNYIDRLLDYTMDCTTSYERMFDSEWSRFASRIKSRINDTVYYFFQRGIIKKMKRIPVYKSLSMKVSYKPKNFLEATQEYIASLFSCIPNVENRPLVFDQLFPPDEPERFFKYVPDTVKTIVVVRDPRDTYLLTKCAYDYSPVPMPLNSVQEYIEFYKKTVYDECHSDDENVLYVHFEDLVYDYEETRKRIELFLGINKHVRPFTRFNPAVSINNTQLFKKFGEYREDVNLIEKAIPEALYNFSTDFIHNSDIIF